MLKELNVNLSKAQPNDGKWLFLLVLKKTWRPHEICHLYSALAFKREEIV